LQVSDQTSDKTVFDCSVSHASKLHYVTVGVYTKVDNNTVQVTCLEDSGTDIPVVKDSVIDQFNMHLIGFVEITGIRGQPVDCKLARLYACLLDDDSTGESKH